MTLLIVVQAMETKSDIIKVFEKASFGLLDYTRDYNTFTSSKEYKELMHLIQQNNGDINKILEILKSKTDD